MAFRKIFLVTLLPLLLVPVYAQEAQTEIPVWVKGVANFWVEGNIDDAEFGEAITFLIEQQIIVIDSAPISKQITMDDQEKRLYDMEITNLEDEVKKVGLDNSHLLNSIIDLQNTIDQRDLELEKYRNDQSSTIGQSKVTQTSDNGYTERIDQQSKEIKDLKDEIVKLQEKLDELQ